MKNDTFIKVILSGILICLIVIAVKLPNTEVTAGSEPYVSVENPGDRLVHVAPNKIGIVDEGASSGWEQLVIFEFNEETGEYEVDTTIPYEDIFIHPEFNDIPLRSDSYGN